MTIKCSQESYSNQKRFTNPLRPLGSEILVIFNFNFEHLREKFRIFPEQRQEVAFIFVTNACYLNPVYPAGLPITLIKKKKFENEMKIFFIK